MRPSLPPRVAPGSDAEVCLPVPFRRTTHGPSYVTSSTSKKIVKRSIDVIFDVVSGAPCELTLDHARPPVIEIVSKFLRLGSQCACVSRVWMPTYQLTYMLTIFHDYTATLDIYPVIILILPVTS